MKKSTALSSVFSKKNLHKLFFGHSHRSALFNKILFTLSILVFSLFAVEAVMPTSFIVKSIEIFFGVLFCIEYGIRLWIAPHKWAYFFDGFSLVDIIVIISLFMPSLIGNLAILRVVRSFKILRTYRILEVAGKENSFIGKNIDILIAILNFVVFLFVMTVIVFVSQSPINQHINSYVDALYFTVTTLTTTGFGDIIPVGTVGRILSVLIMIFGITLFVKLTRSIFRYSKTYYTCPACGLRTHDLDATHCKHCGHVIKNPLAGKNE